ncbi:MAG: glycerol-3-phosphate dehydrogenase [Chloroflexi bacterium RBG_16_58_14]|nr:MAG: glycerol-3-phosphate dehydrogenase [Chloroflexi bacterium RBG_16_58_14]
MNKVMILGAGLMGTAFSFPLADRGCQVNLVGTHLDTDIIEEIHQNRVHPKLRSRVPDGVTPYPVAALEEAVSGVDLVVLGVNSLGVKWAAEMLGRVLPPGVPVLMLTKGLSGSQHGLSILPDILRGGLPPALRDGLSIVAVGGPSIAGELASRRHTCVVFAGSDSALLEKLRRMLQTPYYHIWTSIDLVGVEACVALKNAYALAVGLVHGWLEREGVAANGAVMYNSAAAIFAQGLYETAYLVQHLGGQLSSVYSLPGAGDLYVTSMGGRNGRMGRLLALGWNYQEAKEKHMPDETVEGAELLLEIGPALESLVENGKLDGARLPLLMTMVKVVCEHAPLAIPWERFFQGETISNL